MQEAGLGGCGGRSGPQSVNLCKGMCIDWGKKKKKASVLSLEMAVAGQD